MSKKGMKIATWILLIIMVLGLISTLIVYFI